ncbi:glycosyltransferase family 4 protein [Aquipseudomonas alcaligenes]|uniref:glycosyltransferase family 4 protein n=1 Tax=Aquipseudomonas alcaligenes TaxID=43263 RepID=UPI003747EAFC
MNEPPLIIFFLSVDWFFCSHFIERAIAAQKAGYRVLIICNVDRHAAVIEAASLRLIAIPINRRSLNPFAALLTLARVYQVYRREKPTLVHQVALKPILLGSVASWLAGVPGTLNAIVGGGYLFNSPRMLIKAIRPFLINALGFLLQRRGSWTVFENADDLQEFRREGLVAASHSVLIRGAGVEPGDYPRSTLAAAPPLVVVTARLLWDKGIHEFVEAARMLRRQGVKARFVIVGDPDSANRACIDTATLDAWKEEGIVELWGFRSDIPKILAEASIACLPSYREGLPKSLLEAMAAGLPCVTTDVPGCREAVRDGDNGLLVPARDAQKLAAALERLLSNPALAKKMGQRGRERLEQEFSALHVNESTLALYRKILSE